MIKQIMKNPMQRFTGTGFSSNLPVLTGTGDKNRMKKNNQQREQAIPALRISTLHHNTSLWLFYMW